ncbi:uncharacterized protein LOC119271580 [Triticum dicoccoides]|uniref:uncharacterized protein LOC119271580 n=1 Tax=Triticum dicoccoides TaxID=85692 RepID=UPI0018905C9B|nr:uncharacterized protein LOC119271580 [Triticum dicoccoides]
MSSSANRHLPVRCQIQVPVANGPRAPVRHAAARNWCPATGSVKLRPSPGLARSPLPRQVCLRLCFARSNLLLPALLDRAAPTSSSPPRSTRLRVASAPDASSSRARRPRLLSSSPFPFCFSDYIALSLSLPQTGAPAGATIIGDGLLPAGSDAPRVLGLVPVSRALRRTTCATRKPLLRPCIPYFEQEEERAPQALTATTPCAWAASSSPG